MPISLCYIKIKVKLHFLLFLKLVYKYEISMILTRKCHTVSPIFKNNFKKIIYFLCIQLCFKSISLEIVFSKDY